ncbi:acyltransferase family protein [Sphingomonas nostoxanthinifaciens]|uniref:acyltransferase family protein n=1 Tax=Sphingomonas nostoxanthinifaciens TaxID=2872652 RepID=UPI001CC1C714|nr:acyltransferase [Sphingomonas nostoxanthinifaciens]UAK26316.1 acyltransferase family protein [Sphingomonas nostoxanthinifaciens]
MSPPVPASPIARHVELDWLRIGAFGLLILYHIGLYFGPWGWHIDAPHPLAWLVYPLLALNPWRMTLLFLVSGYAARAVLARGTAASFLRSRAVRLLLPLAFGVLVVMAPQPWVERMNGGTYHGGLLHYWLHDYLGAIDGTTPSLDNLWFVAYIWAYSLVIGIADATLPPDRSAALQRGFDQIFTGWRALAIPILWLLVLRLILFPTMMPTNRLFTDINGHLAYLPAFLFGFALAGSPAVRAGIAALGRPAALLTLAAYAAMAFAHLLTGADPATGSPAFVAMRVAAAIMSWSTNILLLALAERIVGGSGRWRRTLNEAVFPSYIVHQTAIVLIAWSIRPLALPNLAQFALILPGTIAACALFYLIGKASGPFRPLFGLAPLPAARGSG